MADNELKHGGGGVVGCMLAIELELELVGDNHELNMLITCDVEDAVIQLWFFFYREKMTHQRSYDEK